MFGQLDELCRGHRHRYDLNNSTLTSNRRVVRYSKYQLLNKHFRSAHRIVREEQILRLRGMLGNESRVIIGRVGVFSCGFCFCSSLLLL